METEGSSIRYDITLDFKTVKMPPVRDILVLAKKFPQGKTGVMECFRFIAPDEFVMIDIPEPEEIVEAVMISKRVLSRISVDNLIGLLREHVFPRISKGEAINVDITMNMQVKGITLEEKT